jgi:MFS family permease
VDQRGIGVSAGPPVTLSVGPVAPTALRAPGALLTVVCSVIFFDALDLSITQIALPGIQAGLGVPTPLLPWVAAAYVVTYGGFLLLGGRVTDLVGARPMLLGGLALFGAASLACGLAPGAGVLIAARAVQGVGAAATVPAAVALLATSFPEGPRRTRAFAIFAAAASSGFAGGLVAGGVITEGLSWRWVFLLKVPLVAVVLAVAAFAVPRTGRARRGSSDVAGGVAVTAGAVLLTLAVTLAGDPGTGWPVVAGLLVAAVAVLAVFVRIERRAAEPLLPLRLLRNRALVGADLAASTVLAAPFGVSFVVTLYLQDVLHRSPWQTALTLLPGSVLSAVVGVVLAPRLVDRFGLRATSVAALVTVAVGDAGLLALTPDRAGWLVVVATAVGFGFGMGVAYPAATVGGVAGVDEADNGTAAGLNNTALQVGGGLGLALVGAAVAAALGGAPPGTVPPDTALTAARTGAVVATVLPLIGAVLAAVLLPRAARPAPEPARSD